MLMESMLTKCEGTYVFNSTLDCTGPSVLLNPMPLGSCQSNVNGFGLRIGGSGTAYRTACTSDYANLPRPFGGNSIVLFQYNNDMCDGPATAFSKLPLEQPYQSTRYTQVVSCSTGVPVLSLQLGGLSVAEFSIYMSPDCSYLDQSLTTSSFLQRRTPSNPLGLVYFSSQIFSACPAVNPPTPTLTSVPAPNAQTTALINGLAAAVAVLAGGILLAICAELSSRNKRRRQQAHVYEAAASHHPASGVVSGTETLNPLTPIGFRHHDDQGLTEEYL